MQRAPELTAEPLVAPAPTQQASETAQHTPRFLTPLRSVEPMRSRVLLVASTGGHLKQLHRLHTRITHPADEVTWLTFDTPQSRSLLAGEDVAFVPFTGPRDYRGVAGNLLPVLRLLRLEAYDTVISTGSAVALDCLPAAAALGIEAHYIESAARSHGPSTTGRLLACAPGVRTYTQYSHWATDRWRFAGSVFDGFMGVPHPAPADLDGARVVVTLGTLRFPFPRLIQRLREILPETAEILWQTGSTDPRPFGVEGHAQLPNSVLRQEIKNADIVIAHAGVGAALEALEAGQCPVLVPRRIVHGEHIDDHQIQIAGELGRRGLAVSRSVGDLTVDALHTALSTTVVEDPATERMDLSAPGIRGALVRGRVRRLRQRAPRVQRLGADA